MIMLIHFIKRSDSKLNWFCFKKNQDRLKIKFSKNLLPKKLQTIYKNILV